MLVRREQKTSRLGSYLYCHDEHNKYAGLCISSSLLRGKQSISSNVASKTPTCYVVSLHNEMGSISEFKLMLCLKTQTSLDAANTTRRHVFLYLHLFFILYSPRKEPFVPLAGELWALLDEVP